MKHAAVLAAAALAACGTASAHPHGSVACRAEVRMEQGALQSLRGELVLDAEHSRQAIALVRDTPEGAPDPLRLQRLGFALGLQLARWNWLFALEADGSAVAIVAGEPRLAISGEQVRVSVDLQPQGGARVATQWTLRCADPTWYWVAEMTQPVQVRGCGAQQEVHAVRAAAAAGFQWSCGAGLSP